MGYVTPKCGASARVTVTVEVSRCGSWDGNCTLDQIQKQAAEDAVGYIRQRTEKDGRLRIVGEPVVVSIITERER